MIESLRIYPPSKASIKMLSILLLFLLIFRHWMFYLPVAPILTEMGREQPIYGVALIPVTASFGFLYFWLREVRPLSPRDFFWTIFIGLIPFMIATLKLDAFSPFTYPYEADSRRPSFLILMPIALAILLSHFPIKITSIGVIISIIFILSGKITQFVPYYTTMFLAFWILNSGLQKRLTRKDLIGAIPLYLVCFLAVIVLNVKRVTFVHEFLFASAYLSILHLIACSLIGWSGIKNTLQLVSGFKISIFYFAQAAIFTLLAYFINGRVIEAYLLLLAVPIVFVSSLASALVISGVISRAAMKRKRYRA